MSLTSAPSRRLVVLGASNLVRTLPRLVRAVADTNGGPIEVLAACGHGRSFGMWSGYMLVRGLPGIRQCGLWDALDRADEQASSRPTIALITDVGNDIAYGIPSGVVHDWVADCAERLRARGAHTVMTLPPVTVIERLPRWQFALASQLLFPGRGLEHRAVVDEVRRVAEALGRLAKRLDVMAIEVDPAWYGLDPIHWRRSGQGALIERCLAAWSLPRRRERPTARLTEQLAIRTAQAEETRWLRWTVRSSQPARQLRDGSTLGLY